MLVEGIPSHLVQNMAFIQSNIDSIMSGISQTSQSPSVSFENILSSTLEDDDFNTSFDSIKSVSQPYNNNTSVSPPSNLDDELPTSTLDSIINDDENTNNTVKDAYNSLLNGDVSSSSSLSNIVPNVLNKINNTGSISDKEFFNAESLTPAQITDILKKKGSPFVNQTFEGGKSVGQVIYDYCHQAGTLKQGSHTINPSMIIAIMGAESTFGTDSKNSSNPFNIRINGNFNSVSDFQSSLKMAINTMYNWAISKPSDVNISLFDYAGNKYCENYEKDWKPNVEKYYKEFASLDLFDSDKLDMIKNILSKNNSSNTSSGVNINSLMGMLNNTSGGNSNLLSALSSIPSSNLLNSFESET